MYCSLRCFLLVLPCCFVRAGWCCVLLPVVAAYWLLGLVARCCFLLAGAPAWPRGCSVRLRAVLSLCSVALCCRVVPCCGALLSVLLCSVVGIVGVALCFSYVMPVVRYAVLLFVLFCASVVLPCAVLCCCVRAVWCLRSLPSFVGGSGCLFLFSGGACRPWCPCLAPVRPPCCLVCWCGALWCPAPYAVSCGAVLPCGAALSCCVVRLSTLLILVFAFVLHASAKIPCCFSAPSRTF